MINENNINLTKAIVKYNLSCSSCQQNTEIGVCVICEEEFKENENIYCEHYSQVFDCIHYHQRCIDKR